MRLEQILAEIDSEIEHLQYVRRLLLGLDGIKVKRGKAAAARGQAKKTRFNAERRRKISEALKRRWAARKKEASARKSK